QYLFADSGLVNWMLHDVTHVTSQPTSWLAGRWTGMVAVSALGVWKGIGWSMVIFLAALQGVPKELLEAAEMDGAGAWHRFRAVTLPAVRPALLFVTVMLVIGGFNVFTSVLLMTGGGPADSTQVLLTYMYQQAFKNLDFGYGSSIAVLLTLFVFVLSVVQLRVFRGDAEHPLAPAPHRPGRAVPDPGRRRGDHAAAVRLHALDLVQEPGLRAHPAAAVHPAPGDGVELHRRVELARLRPLLRQLADRGGLHHGALAAAQLDDGLRVR